VAPFLISIKIANSHNLNTLKNKRFLAPKRKKTFWNPYRNTSSHFKQNNKQSESEQAKKIKHSEIKKINLMNTN